MRISNFDDVLSQVQGYLPEYLASTGRNPKRAFQCPNEKAHKNGDSNPSAGIVKNNPKVWNCFSCGEKGNILLAAHLIEQMPLKGIGFIETVKTLAERFNIAFEEDDDAEEIIRALGYIAQVVQKGACTPVIKAYLQKRDFTIAETFGIGCADPNQLLELLKKSYELDFIERNQLCRSPLFANRMTFPLHSEAGEVIGFAGRTLIDADSKYVNSKTSIVFQKSNFLYNMHRIKSTSVYVFEGYADVWRAYQNGIPSVACCGTSFTKEQLEILLRHQITDITFVFDGDVAGQKALEQTLKIVEGCTKAQISFISLLGKDEDPDSFIRQHGKEAFLQLPKIIVEEPILKKKDQFLNRLEVIQAKFANDEVIGYRSGFHLYDYRMENIQNGLHLVGGISNIGKSAWMMQIALRMAECNKDVFVLYASIDDNLQMTIPRVVANLGSLPVNQVKNPKLFIDSSSLTHDQKEIQRKRLVMGWNRLRKLTGNLAIIDINDASRLEDIEREIHTFQDIHGKPVALFLDNFHKVRTKAFSNFKERFTYVSEEIKRITSQNNMVTFSTVELTKLGHDGRPESENIKESVDIIYDAETIHLLHQDMHSKHGKTELKFMDGRFPNKDFPILEVAVTKNKISGYKGRIYYKFFSDVMHFEECDQYEQEKYRKIEV
jgi:replicative DNA helicase